MNNSNSLEVSPDHNKGPSSVFYQIFKQKTCFNVPSNQLKIPFEEVSPGLNELNSYSISLFMELESLNPRGEVIIFQIGISTMEKQLKMGIKNDSTLFISYCTNKGMEMMYSQQKLKQGFLYHIVLVFNKENKAKDISLYINGKLESQVALNLNIESPKGNFYFGSESANFCFKGFIWDAVLFLGPVEQFFIKEMTGYNQGVLHGFHDKNASFSNQESLMKKTGVPLTVIKSYRGDSIEHSEIQSPYKRMETEKDRPLGYYIKKMNEFFERNNELYEKSREICFNFEWIYSTLFMLSPPVEENSIRLPFNCLNRFITPDGSKLVHVIEFLRFIRVLQQLDINISKEEIFILAKQIDCLKTDPEFERYTLDVPKKNASKYINKYIIYDKFLLILRNSSLTQDEIKFLRMNYRSNPLKEEFKDSVQEGENSPGLPDEPLPISYYASSELAIGFDSITQLDNVLNYQMIGLRYYLTKQTHNPYEFEVIYRHISDEKKIFYCKNSFRNEDEKLTEAELLKTELFFDPQNPIKQLGLIFTKEFKFLVEIQFILKNGQILSFPFMIDDQGKDTKPFSSEQLFRHDLQFSPEMIICGFFSSFIIIHNKRFLGGLGIHVIKDPNLYSEDQNKEIEENEPLPNPLETWNQGKFQIIINHCTQCEKHQTTTWHEEADFMEKFNELSSKLKDLFPNIEIIGNYDQPFVYSHFDVYIRGVGPSTDRDEQGRFYLFQKIESLKEFILNFDTRMYQVYEGICLLISAYGDSLELEHAQEEFTKKNEELIQKKWEYAHEFPGEVPSRPEKPRKAGGLEAGMEMICKNWACGKKYKYDDNPTAKMESCRHHPGRYEFGSIHGLWPESWTCCRGNWTAPGCRRGRHKGILAVKDYKLCINHGPLNPIKKKDQNLRPDSVCGKPFYVNSSGDCSYHTGYIIKDKVSKDEIWSCCSGPVSNSEPCFTTQHKYADWPDEEAKIYFVQKAVVNPGIIRDYKQEMFTKTAVWSGFFRKSEPYISIANKTKEKLQREIETENDPRYCLRWACEKIFKQSENKKKKMCKFHPGTWDFGHSGITISKAIDEYNKEKSDNILWKPHWTCCRKPWEAKGCTKGIHKGPLIDEMAERKFKWPSEHAQKYFSKKVSPFWLEKINNEHKHPPETVSIIYNVFAKDYGSGGNIGISLLPRLCDKLKLHLLVISDDLSYHFKFIDVMIGKAQENLVDKDGNIDKDKFIEWWFADLDTIRPL